MTDVVREVRRFGFTGLTDEDLAALSAEAAILVRQDLDALGLSPGEDVVRHLTVLRTCALASLRVRVPRAESISGASVQYEPLSWQVEYARALGRLARGRVQGGVL